ncbi:hypothetical protein [Methylobacterium sp. SD21]|uniref:hypothetical protein n=1 Tax=Methylobacterium litchii TaxID=3138810 RepID=UPI00313C614E
MKVANAYQTQLLDVEADEIEPLYDIVCATMPYESGTTAELLLRLRMRMERRMRNGQGMYLNVHQFHTIVRMKDKWNIGDK